MDIPGRAGRRLRAREVTVTCLLAALLFSACGQVAQPVSTETATQSGTNTVRAPTITKSPTRTKLPTWTSPLLPTLDVSYQAYKVSSLATQSAEETVVAEYPGNCGTNSALPLISADRNWLASDCPSERKIVVLSRDGSKHWEITYQEALAGSNVQSPDLEVGAISPYYWSADNRHMYFFIGYCCFDGVEDYAPFSMPLFAEPLYRLDTQTGLWSQFTAPANEHSFSPTDRRLVSIYRNSWECQTANCSIEITILDLKTGDQTKHTLADTLAAGYVVWSSDGKRFFFSAVHTPPNFYMFDYSLYMVDVDAQSIVELQRYEDSSALIYPIELTEDNTLVIQVVTYGPNSQVKTENQYLDVATNQFVTPTSTPTP